MSDVPLLAAGTVLAWHYNGRIASAFCHLVLRRAFRNAHTIPGFHGFSNPTTTRSLADTRLALDVGGPTMSLGLHAYTSPATTWTTSCSCYTLKSTSTGMVTLYIIRRTDCHSASTEWLPTLHYLHRTLAMDRCRGCVTLAIKQWACKGKEVTTRLSSTCTIVSFVRARQTRFTMPASVSALVSWPYVWKH